MSEVWKARDTRLNRIVAVKQLKSHRRARFLQEAHAVAALNHPHICQIYDIGADYLVMEFVEGKPPRGPLRVEEAVKLALQIASALEEAHGRGILHRDLKPANILVTAKGVAKLLDFGLAKFLTDSSIDITQTMEGAVLGTAPYMAPEQAEGKPVDERSDIFSFGTVLYEMLSGQRAFRGGSKAAVLSAVLRDDPPPLQVPVELQYILVRCLAKQPQDRFPHVSDVRVALEQVSIQASIQASETHSSIVIPPLLPTRRTTVGRDRERTHLWRAYERMKQGRSLILAVSGEAGIGKTSLLEDFLAELSNRGETAVVGHGRCSERLAGAEAYLPIIEAIESLLHRKSGTPLSGGVMKSVAPTWYGLVAGEATQTSATAGPRVAAPAASQERMKRELYALCQEVSKTQPLVVFIEDLHWADVSTIDILNYLAGRFAEMHVLVLVSYRPSDMALARHPFLAIRGDLQSRGVFEEINLGFLEAKDVERYLAIQFPGNRFPADFASTIHAKTDGSPLFMTDLVRYLRDTGGIVEENGRWALARALPEAPRDLPESVRGMIQRKIERIDERDRALLLAASVQGHEFDSAIVAEAGEMDPAEVEDRLDALEKVHVLVRRGEEREFPDRSLTLNYQFVHVLYQNTLYASLQPTRRATLSGRVAKGLIARHTDHVSGIAARLGVLLEAARNFQESAKYFYLAARRSAGLSAFREALSLAERGLSALKGLPDNLERQQREVQLQMMKGVALRSTTGWATPEIEQVFTRAWQLCQDRDDLRQVIPVLWANALFLMIRGNLRGCRDRASELMAQAERSGDAAHLMAAFHVSGVVREFIGEMVESSRLLERSRELHVPSEHLTYFAMYGQDPGMTARAMSSRSLWALGYPDRALARATETLDLARTLRQPTILAFALVVIQGIHLYRGEAAESLTYGDEVMTICRDYELPQESQWSRAFQGYALNLLGRTSEGIEVLKGSLAALQAISSGLVRTAFLALLADSLRHAGRVEEGLQAVEEGLAHAERTFEGGYVAELLRARGELLWLAGDLTAAETSLREAIDSAARQEAKSFELRSATALAKLLRSTGRLDEAHAILTPVCEWFTEGDSAADLTAARALLAEIR